MKQSDRDIIVIINMNVIAGLVGGEGAGMQKILEHSGEEPLALLW